MTRKHLPLLGAALLLAGAASLCLAQDDKPANKTISPLDATAAPPSSPRGGYSDDMASAMQPAVPVNPANPNPNAIYAGSLSRADRAFLRAANQGGLFEIQTGDFAGMNGATYAARKLGRHVARDHRQLNATLGSVARAQGLVLTDDLAPATRERIGALTPLSGPAFDRAYIKALAKAHRDDIAAFENEAQTTRNPRLRDAVNDALPTLRMHLQMVEDARANLIK